MKSKWAVIIIVLKESHHVGVMNVYTSLSFSSSLFCLQRRTASLGDFYFLYLSSSSCIRELIIIIIIIASLVGLKVLVSRRVEYKQHEYGKVHIIDNGRPPSLYILHGFNPFL